MNKRAIVRVQATGGTFNAEVALNVKLDPENMPVRLTGVFSKLPSEDLLDSEVANLMLHSDRTDGGMSHTIWFNGNRTGYRFIMSSGMALDFTAEKI